MAYVINDSGELSETKYGSPDIESAITARIRQLESLVENTHELEIDYDDENDTWQAMYYNADTENAFDIYENGHAVIAFLGDSHENGIDFDIIDSYLYDHDILYVT